MASSCTSQPNATQLTTQSRDDVLVMVWTHSPFTSVPDAHKMQPWRVSSTQDAQWLQHAAHSIRTQANASTQREYHMKRML